MGNSIQENAKKINSSLSIPAVLSLLITALFLAAFALYLLHAASQQKKEVAYATENDVRHQTDNIRSLPFASKNGTTYTFSWCQGAAAILEKNKIYFSSESEAITSGRRLSKLCQK